MGQTVNGMRKIEALQKASLKLLKTLSDASAETESIKVSIVPFNTQVRLNAAETGANPYWVSFTGGVSAANWMGYVEDRKQPYDANDAEPRIAQDDTLYPAVARAYPLDLAPVQSLTQRALGLCSAEGNDRRNAADRQYQHHSGRDLGTRDAVREQALAGRGRVRRA